MTPRQRQKKIPKNAKNTTTNTRHLIFRLLVNFIILHLVKYTILSLICVLFESVSFALRGFSMREY